MCVHIQCGYSLQTLTEKLAILEIVIGVICTLVFGTGGVVFIIFPPIPIALHELRNFENHENDHGLLRGELSKFVQIDPCTKLLVVSLVVLYFLSGITLGLLLLTAAQLRNLRNLRIWMYLQSIECIVRLLLFIYLLYFAAEKRRTDIALAYILVNIYAGFVLLSVRKFLDEVRIENICSRNNNNTDNSRTAFFL